MSWYATARDEVNANRRAAARAGGCVPVFMRGDGVGGEEWGARFVGLVSCDDGWAAARYLLALAEEDARTPGARAIAAELRRRYPRDEDFARALVSFVKRNVRFERERGELFQNGGFTLRRAAGDCDDHFRLLHAIARAGGLPSSLALLHHGDDAPPEARGPTHAVAMLGIPQGWAWAETTVDAALGEHPFDAAIRLGLLQSRGDLAKEVRIMTERDLAPVPAGFAARQTAAQVERDAEALQRLGYFAGDVTGDATDEALRRAVLAFQVDHPELAADGLLGPRTRSVIAAALQQAGPPVTEGFDYTIGELAPSPAVPRFSKHLSPAFLRAVGAMAALFQSRGARASAEDFLLVWLSESGIDSHRPNGQGAPFGGLNQMGPDERKAAGFLGTFGDFLALSPEEQLPYVQRYYENAVNGGARGDFSVLADAASLYLANAAPAFMSHAGDPDFVIFRRDPNGPEVGAPESAWAAWRATHKGDPYAWNRGLDRRKDGTIRVGDLKGTLAAAANGQKPYWDEVRARLAAELGGAGSPDGVAGSGASVAGLVLLAAVGSAIGAYFAVRS